MTEVTWWYSLPTKTKPFRAQMSLSFVSGGKLQQLVRSLSAGRRRLEVQRTDHGVIADASVNIRLPKSYQQLLANAAKANDVLPDLASPFIRNDIECHVTVSDLGVGKPTALFVGLTDRESQVVRVGVLEKLPGVESVHYRVDSQEIAGQPTVAGQAHLDGEFIGAVDVAELFQRATGTSDRSWLRARIDLSQWTNRLDSSGELLVVLVLKPAYRDWLSA